MTEERVWLFRTSPATVRAEEGVKPPWILIGDSSTQRMRVLRAQVSGLHPVVAMRWDPNLCSRGVSGTIEVGPPSAPIPEASEPQLELMIPSGVLLTATSEGVVPPSRETEPVHVLALTTGSSGAEPFAGAYSTSFEGGLGLEALTPDNFMLCPEALRAFASASSLLKSGEIEQLVAWGQLEDLEARLEAATLQVRG